MKLQDVCVSMSSNIAQKDIKDCIGNYPIYGASGLIGNVDYYKQEAPYIGIVKDGAGVGRVYMLPAKSSVIGTMQYIIPNSNIDLNYLYYALQHMHLEKYSTGTTIPHIYFRDYQFEPISLPTPHEQRRKSNILQHSDKIISTRSMQLEIIDTLVKSRFIEMFGDARENPNNFDIVPFIDVVEYMGDIGSNGANKVVVEHLDMKDEEDYAIMVRFTNFTQNDFSDDVKYISKDSYDFFKKSQLFGGELIICKIGSAGQNYVMPYMNRPVSLGLNQIMVRVKDSILMPYLYQYLHTDYGKFLISGCINGAVTKTITKTELKKIPIMMAPLELQNQFADFVALTDKSKFAIQQSIDTLQTLKAKLMQDYFG